MKSPLDYYENLELTPEALPPAEAGMPEAQEASGLVDATVLVEVGDTCLTRSAVQEAVHEAVSDAVQAAVSGAVAAAVAAAVKANVAVDPLEAENRFRQKYLGLASVTGGQDCTLETGAIFAAPDPLLVEEPQLMDVPRFVEVPQLVACEDGSVVAPPVSVLAVPALAVSVLAESEALNSEAELECMTAADLTECSELPVAEPVKIPEEVFESVPVPEILEAVPVPEILEAVPVPEILEAVPVPEIAEAVEVPEIAEAVEVAEIAEAVEVPEIAEAVEVPEIAEAVEVLGVPEVLKVMEAQLLAQAPVSEVMATTKCSDAAGSDHAEKTPSAPATDWARPISAPAPSQELLLRDEKTIQFVGFLVGGQMYAVPSIMIREVLRKQPVSRLPVHTRFVSGVINLRGGVIPLVSLRELLQAGAPEDGCYDQFCIITGAEGMWVGLAVDRIRSMYVVKQEDIVWNVSGLLGLDDESIIGLFELDEKLVPVLSVERVGAILLEEGLDMDALAAT